MDSAIAHTIAMKKNSASATVTDMDDGLESVGFMPGSREDAMRANQKAVEGFPTAAGTGLSGEPTVLIVDDESPIRKLIVRLLNRFYPFCRVAQAADVPEAKEKLLNLFPRLAIVDLQMPNGNGLELCRLIQRHPWFSRTRVLIITGYPSSRAREKTFDGGAIEFLSKPFTAEELIGCIGRLLA